MNSLTFEELNQITKAVGSLDGWDFSRVRAERAPTLWHYLDVVHQYLKPTDRVLDIGTGGCHILAQAEYDVPYWFKDVESFMFWLMSVPWPESIEIEKHWQNINRILETAQTNRGIETNEHRGLLVVQKL